MCSSDLGFIRRPFLYTSFWLGAVGGFFACLCNSIALLLLQQPIAEITALYQSSFALQALLPVEILSIMAAGALLGMIGAWLAVDNTLKTFSPTR